MNACTQPLFGHPHRYYQGELSSLDESEEDEDMADGTAAERRSGNKAGAGPGSSAAAAAAAANGSNENTLLTERVAPRANLPPLLVSLADR